MQMKTQFTYEWPSTVKKVNRDHTVQSKGLNSYGFVLTTSYCCLLLVWLTCCLCWQVVILFHEEGDQKSLWSNCLFRIWVCF